MWDYRVPGGQTSGDESWVCGRTLGGSSSVNGSIYDRGGPSDWDELSSLTGPDWAWGRTEVAFRDIEVPHVTPRLIAGRVPVTTGAPAELCDAMGSCAAWGCPPHRSANPHRAVHAGPYALGKPVRLKAADTRSRRSAGPVG